MRELVELAARVAELERRFSGVLRHGTVAQVDPEKATLRLTFWSDQCIGTATACIQSPEGDSVVICWPTVGGV